MGGITSYTTPTPTTQDLFAASTSTDASYGLDTFSDHYFLTFTNGGVDYALTSGTVSTFSLTGTGGSSIFGTITLDQGSNPGPGQQQQFMTNYAISGGTGQFAGTTGSLNVTNGSANYQGNSGASYVSGTIVTPSVSAAVPEPGSLALFGLGLPGLVLLARKRRGSLG